MKPTGLATRTFPLDLFLAACAVLAAGTAPAATNYWNGVGTGWDSAASWSTAAGATTPNPAAAPGLLDAAIFNITTDNSAQAINLNSSQSVNSLAFNSTGTTTLLGNGVAGYTLTVGLGGLGIGSSAGAITLGNGTAENNVSIYLASGQQAWVNNSANAFTINDTAGAAFSRATGATLSFSPVGAGSFNIPTTILPNTGTGIVGPWAFFGTGASAKYAYNSTGTLAGLSLTAVAPAAVTDTTGTVNYEVNAAGTLGAGASFNTLRYTGAAGTLAGTWAANGLMNVGGGALVSSGAGTIGGGKELVVHTASGDITLSGVVTDNGGGASALVKTGPGTLTFSAKNTYAGPTTINAGTLNLSLGDGPAKSLSGVITVNNGGTLTFGGYSSLGGWQNSSTNTTPVVVNAGGTINQNANSFQQYNNLTLAGGKLISNGGFQSAGSWGAVNLFGTLTVTANSSIVIGGSTHNDLSPGANTANQILTIDVWAGATFTNNLPIMDFDSTRIYSITKVGAGTAIFYAVSPDQPPYSGNTTISAGTLAIGSAALISRSAAISIAAGATYDVSAISAYALSANSSLLASGTGTAVGTSAAAIKGASAGTVSLGARPISLRSREKMVYGKEVLHKTLSGAIGVSRLKLLGRIRRKLARLPPIWGFRPFPMNLGSF